MKKTIRRFIAAALCLSLLMGTLTACTDKNTGKYEPETKSQNEGSLKEGNRLYKEYPDKHINNIEDELPEKIVVVLDDEGYQIIGETSDAAKIRQLVSLFKEGRVGKNEDVFVTESYNSVNFVWKDGTQTVIALN
ncbi:MAG: hypothetical protein IKS18_04740, partial [Lachnospiraceae bacterium]|nr:hypothetical protein [Lachnospiraceae bacterium]